MYYYILILGQDTPVVDSTKRDYSGSTIPAGTYTGVLITNPFNTPEKTFEPWIAIVGKEHLGQCKSAWEERSWVTLTVLKA